jgi:hypothetical protein
MRADLLSWQPELILTRGLGWGSVGGAACGTLIMIAISVADRSPFGLVLCVLAAPVGAAIGALLGLLSPIAVLMLGPRRLLEHPDLARVLAGTMAAVLPVLQLCLDWPASLRQLWSMSNFISLSFATGAILAHRVLWGVWVLPPGATVTDTARPRLPV